MFSNLGHHAWEFGVQCLGFIIKGLGIQDSVFGNDIITYFHWFGLYFSPLICFSIYLASVN